LGQAIGAGDGAPGLIRRIANRGYRMVRESRIHARRNQRERRTRSYPPPCGEGRREAPGWGSCGDPLTDPPPPTPPHKGEGSALSARRSYASSRNENAPFAIRLRREQGHAMLKTVPAFDRIGEENAFAVLARANALAAQGRDIINLGIGQPDFRTPDFIV